LRNTKKAKVSSLQTALQNKLSKLSNFAEKG